MKNVVHTFLMLIITKKVLPGRFWQIVGQYFPVYRFIHTRTVLTHIHNTHYTICYLTIAKSVSCQ